MKTKAISVIIAVLTLLTASVNMQAQYKKYHVSTGGNNSDGLTWGNAFRTLQQAIIAAVDDGDTIFVAKGRYTQTTEYQLFSKNLEIYGSFNGWETSPNQRTFASSDTTILDATGNCRVFSLNTCINGTVIDGFKITGGNTDDGAGMRIEDSFDLKLTNLTISGNHASNHGGGIYNYNSSPELTNVTISGNSIIYRGAGIYNVYSSPKLTNVIISGNTTPYRGGGIYNSTAQSDPILINVTISGNYARFGGGMYNDSPLSTPALYNTIILGNSNGIEGQGAPTFEHSLVEGMAIGGINGNLDGSIIATDVFYSPIAPGQSTSGDFHLRPYSPAIDAGNNSYNNEMYDIEGNQRIFNSIIDLGAYESSDKFPAHIIDDPEGKDELCNNLSHIMTVNAIGTNLNFQWFKDGEAISGATNEAYLVSDAQLTDAGAYAVRVTADVGSPVLSNTAKVKVTNPIKIVTDLPDNITFSSSPATLSIEATGDNLNYQWYSGTDANHKLIPGANSDNITIRDEGFYHVIVNDNCTNNASNMVYVNFNYVIPVINRRVTLPQVQGIMTNPIAGTYFVRSRDNFVFDMWPATGYNLQSVTVSTDRGNDVSLTNLSPALSQGEGAGSLPLGEGQGGAFRVTVKHIITETVIRIDGAVPVSNSPGLQIRDNEGATGVWSYDDKAYFSLPAPTEISIYTVSGILYDRRTLPAGVTTIALPPGFYIIQTDYKTKIKIVIN